MEEEPSAAVTVKLMVFNPAVEYVTLTGPADVDVAGLAPEPKFHDHETMEPVEVLVNVTVLPVQAFSGEAVKSATGAPMAMMGNRHKNTNRRLIP